MLVKIIRQVVYTPTPHDSHRCYGQLRTRASVVETPAIVEKHDDDGQMIKVQATLKTCGPMETYFPVGATPELSEETARDMIQRGDAEVYTGEQIINVSADDILRSMAADSLAVTP